MHRNAIAIGFLAVACTVGAQAPQTTGPDSLPRGLVEALLRASVSVYPGDGSQFVVGHVPASLGPFLYLPQGTRVLGGLEGPNVTLAVFEVRMSREELRSAYARELPRLGWTPATGRSGFAGWGFMPAPGTGQYGTSLEFCHIGQTLQINPTETPAGLSVSAVVRTYGGACGGRSVTFVSNPPGVDMPTLVNPVDAGMNGPECYPPTAFNIGGRTVSERLKTTTSPDKLLEHYARQLADSGWTASGAQGMSVRRTWTHPDTANMVREVTLSIGPSMVSGCYDVSMQLRQVRKP